MKKVEKNGDKKVGGKKKMVAKKSVGHIPTSCHWALVWPRSKSPEMAWNGTEFFLIVFKIFNRVVFPYDFWQKKSFFRILLGMSWYVFEPLLSDF